MKRLAVRQHFCLSFFWFATSVHWSAILLVLLPLQVLALVGDERKGQGVGFAIGVGAVIALLLPPVAGALSDRSRLRWGRRRPYLLLGALLNFVSLLGLAYLPAAASGQLFGVAAAYLVYVAAFAAVEFGNNLATAPYAALIPDVVPAAERGRASGWMGLMTMLGSFVGGVSGLLLGVVGVELIYWALAGLILVGAVVTAAGVPEPPLPPQRPARPWRELLRGLVLDPRAHPDFAWVFFTRFLVMMGIFTVQEFLQYYLKDVVGAPFVLFGVEVAQDAAGAVSFFVVPLLIGATAAAFASGTLSDRHGRKLLVYLAGALMGATALAFVFLETFLAAVLLGLVFGLGYGAYTSVDWALATDVLPSADDHAKDMGIWHIAEVLPQVVAIPIGGALLDHFQLVGRASGWPTLGYVVIFAVAVAYFALGTLLVRQVRGAR